jgi:cell division protein FtsW (lipid II flippase)
MRRIERRLLALVIAIGFASFIIIDLTARGFVSLVSITISLVNSLYFLAVHLIITKKRPSADQLLLPTVALLSFLGVAMIYRLGGGSEALNQTIWVGLSALISILLLIKAPHTRVLLRTPLVFMLTGVLLIATPLLPFIGATINGATLWLRVGSLSVQPAEFAKVALILGFAGFLATRQTQLTWIQHSVMGIGFPRPKDILPLLVIWFLSLLILILQRDLGSSLLFFLSAVLLLYITTGRIGWLITGAMLLVIGSTFAILLFDHVAQRFSIWQNPFADSAGSGYQVVQAIYGLAAGGIFGTGLGNGNPDLVPYAESDFIFAAIAEELGLVGAVAVLLLYALIISKALKTANLQKSAGSSLIASGIAVFMFLQVVITIGGVTSLLPLTGLTTPFLSAGGSSLLANYILITILMLLQDQDRRVVAADSPLDDDLTRAIKL